jgi:hypothetical protein
MVRNLMSKSWRFQPCVVNRPSIYQARLVPRKRQRQLKSGSTISYPRRTRRPVAEWYLVPNRKSLNRTNHKYERKIHETIQERQTHRPDQRPQANQRCQRTSESPNSRMEPVTEPRSARGDRIQSARHATPVSFRSDPNRSSAA